jgi:hypothetical protein
MITVHSLADLLSDLLVPYSASSSLEHRVVPYAPRYRLAFTLLNEDASEGHAATDWEVRSVISSVCASPQRPRHALTFCRPHNPNSQKPCHPP